MGDKTQLATISLAVKYTYQSFLSGWVQPSAMIISNGFGMYSRNVMGRHIPEKTIKWVSALIFIVFGGFGLYEICRKIS